MAASTNARDSPGVSLRRDPFSDPDAISIAPSRTGRHRPNASSSCASYTSNSLRKSSYEFKSYRLKEAFQQPWRDDLRLQKHRRSRWIILLIAIVGLLLSGYIHFATIYHMPRHDYCLVLDDQFKTLNTEVWRREIQLNGFGTGSFDWTTDDSRNSYVDSDGLHIVPTLTTETTIYTEETIRNGASLNLTAGTGPGDCTGSTYLECSAIANDTKGAIIPPVRSARLNTKGRKSIRYGRVEVVAKLPKGDWLWPAIWMMPDASAYGEWPASGEIDIMESRGNNVDYDLGGRDKFASALHWGPTAKTDAFWRTTAGRALRRSDYSKDFHTFGLEWSKDYISTYIDNRLQEIFYVNFKKEQSLWDRGKFASQSENSTMIPNPWAKSGSNNAPFDKEFYLILNVAVGSRNGWFPDGKGGKPWVDRGDSAVLDFYKAKEQWYPSWGKGSDRGMTVRSVKMWQEGKCT